MGFKYLAGVVAPLVVLGVFLTGVRYCTRYTDTIVERKILEESFQYKEGRKTEILTFQAQLNEIDVKLSNPSLDPNTRNNLEAQAAMIRTQLSVAKNK